MCLQRRNVVAVLYTKYSFFQAYIPGEYDTITDEVVGGGLRPPPVVLCLWRDGSLIWSEDAIMGGPPYYFADIGEAAVQSFFGELRATGVLTSGPPSYFHGTLDTTTTAIVLKIGGRSLDLETDYELDRARGMSSQIEKDAEFLAFIERWDATKKVLMAVRPSRGIRIKDPGFDISMLRLNNDQNDEGRVLRISAEGSRVEGSLESRSE